MKVLLGGGTGFIGRYLSKALIDRGHSVVVISRTPRLKAVTWQQLDSQQSLPDCDAVVNLSGENILNFMRRWNDKYKQDVYESRIGKNKLLVNLICQATKKPKVWVSAHAVGYYPVTDEKEFDEDYVLKTPKTYIESLCKDWENSAVLPDTESTRHVGIRIGVVLGPDGGIIQQSYWPFYFGLGGVIGSGKQYFHWVHIKDIVNLFVHAIENEFVTGILNGVAPNPCTNETFTRTFGAVLNRPTWFSVPEFAMKFAAGTERSDIILKGNKVIPKRTLESGFEFQYPDIKNAMKDILKK
ncbi:epimerase family protein SDR39U1 [Hydra vulgaris]|uniref:epimerase family protein SDR39U1 n=1 Tax=Hydra vulgaris TaxID=6087 RepID=UPI0002B43886|nr:epimerase family protein SDR39U1 [Hydra vulgaris]